MLFSFTLSTRVNGRQDAETGEATELYSNERRSAHEQKLTSKYCLQDESESPMSKHENHDIFVVQEYFYTKFSLFI